MHVNEAILDLYRDAYSSEKHLHDLNRLVEILRQGENVEIFNPFFPSDSEYWSFHENILTHSDIEHSLPPHSDTPIGRHAKAAIGILVSFGCTFPGYAGKTPDDVEYAVTEALLFGEYEKYGVQASDSINLAAKNGLINKSFVEGLLALRELVEKERYPNVIQRAKRIVKATSDRVKSMRISRAKSKIVKKIKARESS